MNHGTFKAFEAVNQRLDRIETLLAALVTELSNDAEAKALAAELKTHREGLNAAFPASAGTTPP